MASIHGFIKYTFVLLNCVLIVFASITVAAGLLLYFDRFYGYSLIEIPYLSHLWSPADLLVSPSMLIIIGTCCFFFGSVGLYSGLADSKIGFGIYSVPLLFLAIIHICVGLALYGFPKQNPDVIKESLNKTFLKGVEDNSSPEFHLINDIQSCFQCCGATSSNDYKDVPPKSCFNSDHELNENGCTNVVFEFLIERIPVYGRIILVFTVVEFITVIIAWCACYYKPRSQYHQIE